MKSTTLRFTFAECVSEPFVPVMVTVELPKGVVALVVIVIVEVVPGAIEAGLNETVAPAGSPLTVRLTAPLKPFRAPTPTLVRVLPPTFTFCELGVADRVKSGPIGTIWIPLIGARRVSLEEVPGVAEIVNDVALIVNTM